MTTYPDVAGPDVSSDPALILLLAHLRARHNDAICCTLLYGSCLRSGDIYDGLLDLYLICDNYREAYQHPLLAAANWMLPPNVFYAEQKPLEQAPGAQTLRCKVTVISLRDFQRGCTRAWFESYIWGRFAQPTRILYSRDQHVRDQVHNCLLQAARTLLRNTIPALPQQGSLIGLWEQSLALSYATELRTERNDRATELALSARDFYTNMTQQHADSLGFHFALSEVNGELQYQHQVGQMQHYWGTLAWALRRGQGKLLSILRLIKALLTFDGGMDYIAWKLERHSGEEIVIPDRVRKAPFLFMWGFFWELYRRGLFK